MYIILYIDSQDVQLGSFRMLQHRVRGDVYAVDEKTIRVENFRYDGAGIGKLINQYLIIVQCMNCMNLKCMIC